MIEVKEKIIDGSVYAVKQMTARTALRMQSRLIKVLGPFLGEFMSSAASKSGKFGDAMQALGNALDPNSFESLVMDLMQFVRKNGMEMNAGTIDLEFAGNLNTLFEVLAFVLEVNYGDFFKEGGIMQVFLQAFQTQVPAE